MKQAPWLVNNLFTPVNIVNCISLILEIFPRPLENFALKRLLKQLHFALDASVFASLLTVHVEDHFTEINSIALTA